MRLLPRISLPVHGLAELALGIALIVAGAVAGLGDLGTVLTLGSGFVVTGIGFGAVSNQPLATHRALDQLVSIALGITAVIAAAGGSATAAALLLIGAAIVLALESATHWSRAI